MVTGLWNCLHTWSSRLQYSMWRLAIRCACLAVYPSASLEKPHKQFVDFEFQVDSFWGDSQSDNVEPYDFASFHGFTSYEVQNGSDSRCCNCTKYSVVWARTWTYSWNHLAHLSCFCMPVWKATNGCYLGYDITNHMVRIERAMRMKTMKVRIRVIDHTVDVSFHLMAEIVFEFVQIKVPACSISNRTSLLTTMWKSLNKNKRRFRFWFVGSFYVQSVAYVEMLPTLYMCSFFTIGTSYVSLVEIWVV